MTWIDDRMQQRREASRRATLIASEAERTYAILWEEIADCVREAEGKGIQVIMNGSPHERMVVLPGNPRKELHVRLKKEKQLIAISGIEPPFELWFDLGDDNVVCLTKDGVKINPEVAAQAILDPFLFPELPPPQVRPKVQNISTFRDGTY
jgi:hypothetical protein